MPGSNPYIWQPEVRVTSCTGTPTLTHYCWHLQWGLLPRLRVAKSQYWNTYARASPLIQTVSTQYWAVSTHRLSTMYTDKTYKRSSEILGCDDFPATSPGSEAQSSTAADFGATPCPPSQAAASSWTASTDYQNKILRHIAPLLMIQNIMLRKFQNWTRL